MWRPVALSAFLALLFMSSRSGQEPVETGTDDTAKADLGAEASGQRTNDIPFEIDPSRSSIHPKSITPTQQSTTAKGSDAVKQDDRRIEVARATTSGSRTIPLPAPKTRPGDSGTRVVVTQGEQKTALTTHEEALRMMPPGPDFAARVQRELVRLGCYHGSIDNIWGPMSRNAVARFNRVAKASISLRQPTRALLSSARKAPDDYCNGGSDQPRLAALEPGDSLEALKSRPEYLPPWMRGEPMPEPGENEVEVADEPEASPDTQASRNTSSSSDTRTRTRSKPRAKPSRTRRAQVQRRRVQRRQVRRRRSRSNSFQKQLGRMNWPGR